MIKLISKKIDSNRTDMFNIYSAVVYDAIKNSRVPFYWDYDRIFAACVAPEGRRRYAALANGNDKLLHKLREILKITDPAETGG